MDITKLAAPFPPEVVSWRVGPTNKDKTKGMALAYIDARDVQDRLTEVCGPFGWQCRHEVSHDKRVTCHIGIKDPESGEWIWRSDGAGESDMDAEKGSYSGSFKRAAVKWGVGRYLYALDSPWVKIEAQGRSYVIAPPESKRLTALLVKGQSVQLGNDRSELDTGAEPSHEFERLRLELAGIETAERLEKWVAAVKAALERGDITENERADLVQRYKARASYIEQKKEAA